MKRITYMVVGAWMVAALGCSSGGSTETPTPDPAGQKQEHVAKGDCTFESCGTMPSSYEGEAKVECSGGTGECTWEPTDPDETSVSYAPCEESECPPRPAIDCPAGTAQASQQCGNENDKGCAWTTVCVPPRETTPCADQHGCDNQPVIDIGIICNDGSYGSFVCVTDDSRCFWERSCD